MKNAGTRLGYVWQSTGCDSYYWQRVGRRLLKGGGNSVKYTPGACVRGLLNAARELESAA